MSARTICCLFGVSRPAAGILGKLPLSGCRPLAAIRGNLYTLLGLAAGCGDDRPTGNGSGSGSGPDLSDQTLSGRIGGEPWTFGAGEVNTFLSDGEDSFFTSLFGETYETCGFGSKPEGHSLIVSVPKQPGDYPFTTQRNGTFVLDTEDGPENIVTFEGRIVVKRVTETEVKASLHMVEGENEVDGTFTAAICP